MAPTRGVSRTIFAETTTMKKFLLASVAVAAFGATAPALAADLGAGSYYNKAPAYAAPIYNWTGFYIGGHIGGAFRRSKKFKSLGPSDHSAPLTCAVHARPPPHLSPNRLLS